MIVLKDPDAVIFCGVSKSDLWEVFNDEVETGL